MRFPWAEVRVAVAALARTQIFHLARESASREMPARAVDVDTVLADALASAEVLSSTVTSRIVDNHPEPPFTTQRLVELLLDADLYGGSPTKLASALGKLLLVTSMVASGAPVDELNDELNENMKATTDEQRHAQDPTSIAQSAFVNVLVGDMCGDRGGVRVSAGDAFLTDNTLTSEPFPGEHFETVAPIPASVVTHARMGTVQNQPLGQQKRSRNDEPEPSLETKRARDAKTKTSSEPPGENDVENSPDAALPGKQEVEVSGVELLTAGA